MNKNILIIGGSSGIGKAVVEQLQGDNNIYVANRSSDNLDLQKVTHIPYDAINDSLDTSLLPEQLDGFVYCPGSINLRPFRGLKPETFDEDFKINVMGAIKSLQAGCIVYLKFFTSSTYNNIDFNSFDIVFMLASSHEYFPYHHLLLSCIFHQAKRIFHLEAIQNFVLII